MNPLPSTPRQDGFRMPAEFEPHAGTWMLWPERPDVWRNRARFAQQAYCEVAAAIARFEPVWMGVSAQSYATARQMLPASVEVIRLDYNDAWARDNGPTFVINDSGEVRGVDWDFNAWGELYADFEQDAQLAREILALRGLARYKCNLVAEGGGLHVDGEGTLLLTEQCILNKNRNPTLSKTFVENQLKEYLNVEKVIWIKEGSYGDETDGHIDALCCFVRPGVIALTWTDDESDPQHAIVKAAYEQLARATDARGRTFEIVKLSQPAPMYSTQEDADGIQRKPGTLPRLANENIGASYINYYVANGGVIVPTYNDPMDEQAIATLQALYPNREVVGVYAREILLGGGMVHCITQQQPQGLAQ